MARCYPVGSDSDIIHYYDYADDVRGDTGTAYSKYRILCGVHRIGAEYPDLFPVCSIGEVSKIQTEMALLALQNECLQENAKDIENMYDTVRALRHDLKNHLLCILSMAEERDVEGIEQYTRQLLQQQNTVNKLIMFSGSKVLDAIINSKSAAAERAGVRLSAIITTPLAGISPEDITIILGNALDNAIRAAKGSQRKVVDIHIQP